jgi:hypothetical protein
MSNTYESLEEKTVAELRNMCRDLEITGMSKKRKSIIIDAIMDASDSDGVANVSTTPITGIRGAFQTNVTNPSMGKGGRLTTVVKVSSGASTGDFDVAGKTVGAVAEFLKEILNISSVSKGIVNGEEAKDDHVLQGGESLEFIQPAGTKG